ncbi:hydrogenase expression/formation protein HypE [Candidatus Aminicenantes bacterium AC-335-A11]|jgi:hydrogenase expression/formation protein HypE|nr:hydrogenase expression/formation protein HypE [SCandidatus Aminicenantes bacterium Aminicenantia_JdfR_composite]MCP2619106.1 hydrogenase expression/formation protein HypE [Candidatus Aminicenantes bacterium AC-335-A11]
MKNKNLKKISLEIGSGGRLMKEFISNEIVSLFNNEILNELHDSALLPENIAFTTDSYVVDPIFFPGGDIGKLCINGTVNDLIVSGAKPLYISLALILEEGFSTRDLRKILNSIKEAADRADVKIVSGDTKVVKKGQGDKIYINTSGIGILISRPRLNDIKPGDKVIVTGTLGEHALSIMLARGDFGLDARIKSDCAPLNFLLPIWKKGVLWMRDITRGGLASVLNELVENLPYSCIIHEEKLPLSSPVKGASEILGIDPLYLACEGRAVMIVEGKKALSILSEIKGNKLGRNASIIGEISEKFGKSGELLLNTLSGGWRLLEPLTSELLPRIC